MVFPSKTERVGHAVISAVEIANRDQNWSALSRRAGRRFGTHTRAGMQRQLRGWPVKGVVGMVNLEIEWVLYHLFAMLLITRVKN